MAATSSTSNLLDLPQELLGHVCFTLDPFEIIALGRTSRRALAFIAPDNVTLWRHAFLREFDDPKDRWVTLLSSAKQAVPAPQHNWDWFIELRRRLTALSDLDSSMPLGPERGYGEIAEILLDIFDTATIAQATRQAATAPERLQGRSKNLAKLCDTARPRRLDGLIDFSYSQPNPSIHDSELIPVSPTRRHYTRSIARYDKSLRPESICRLHILHGLTRLEVLDEGRSRGHARRLTYDWHLTSPASDHGPYQLDGSGRINWQLLEAVCTVISLNISRYISTYLAVPQDLHHNLPNRTLQNPTIPHDWAGITGTWVGTYSFIDYQDLFHYNVGYAPGPRPTLDDEMEACGDLMRLDLKLDDGPQVKNDWRLKSDLPVCESLPVLFFSGTSRGHSGPPRPLINVRGRASLLPGGREVRWRYLISYGGADQWQLEGVQPGGIRSAGVFGLWSHCDHEDHGPVGPFCYFPLELCEPGAVHHEMAA